ncbi:MAG TPA: hypothetical protein VNI77_09595 [Nitrososphaera sp.]|nr:hypothetical protein [Nitrososphaera sp.]
MNESAQFLSLVEKIKAEIAPVVTNLQNNNLSLAQGQASKAAALLDNIVLDEIRKKNERIANALPAAGQDRRKHDITGSAGSDRAVNDTAADEPDSFDVQRHHGEGHFCSGRR